MGKNTYTLTVLGSSFTLRSDEEPDELRRVAEHFEARVMEIQRALPTASPLKVAVLAALNITDELLKERRARQAGIPIPDAEGQEIEAIAERMIATIEDGLREGEG